MAEYIEKPDMQYILHIKSDKKVEQRLIDYLLQSVVDVFEDTGLTADVQPVDKIAKIIQARLNGVQKVKIDAMLSGDCNTAYKMVGEETVCIAILQDLEAIKG